MPFNGSGVFQRVRNWVADAAAGIKIRADYHDTEDDGFAIGLSNCITKDGQTVITQNIPFNSKRITGLADPVGAQDAATKASADAAITTKVSKAGDTMSGGLVVTAGGVTINHETWVGFGTTVGTIRFGNSSSNYLHWNAGAYTLAGGALAIVGQAASVNSLTTSGKIVATGDITSADTVRGNTLAAGSAAAVGVVYLGTNNAHNVNFNNTRYGMPNAPLHIGYPVNADEAARVDWVNSRIATAAVTNSNAAHTVAIGWSGTQLIAQVDATVVGALAFAPTTFTTESLLARIEALEAKVGV